MNKSYLLKKIHISPPQVLSITFLVTILFGAGLLYLPISTISPISFLDALFTATSATTVTGLAVLSTGNDFTLFGQTVIIVLMQIGGLGLMTFAVLIVMLLGKKIGLKGRILIQQSFNQYSLGGMIRLVRIILVFTIVIEGIAAVFLAVRWVPEYGWGFGLFTSAFHAVSAFNNAGFSLWDDSLSAYAGDPAVNIIITLLFITGGIGFTVLYDMWGAKEFRHLSLHSKIMLTGTLAVNLFAMLFLFVSEYGNMETLGSMPLGDKLWASYFQAVTPRTAGFNSIDIGSMETGSIVLISLLMFIGAGSASTGSGIKLTTFLVIILVTASYLNGKKEAVIFNRAIPSHLLERSLAIVFISMTAIFTGILILSYTENAPFEWIVFEAFSAFGTVGLSMGLTGELSNIGKFVIMVLMFIGRVGPVTLAFALARQHREPIRHPKGDIFTG
ncbi:Ktr system potassium transporter B [Planococcus plakortidis]|uniref:Ktr system potassium transporter B n=1 Tax=Planococcus plakortidis TaxID=1038856 RepID=A0A1C7E9F1_9BACL|nr:TrkH family potassium uptake protein [Planococcus plakortidis]ANU20604.1 Ktr system potassium transporter B [Planococcus plakortidis]